MSRLLALLAALTLAFAPAFSSAQSITPGSPSGATGTAGGDLSGTYPNPTVSLVLGATPVTKSSSTTNNCVKWASATALGDAGATCGTSIFPAAVSGQWYLPPFQTLATGSAMTANRAMCQLQIAPVTISVKSLGARSTTTSNGNNIQIAIYANSASNRPTGSPLASTGNIALGASAGLLSGTPSTNPFTIPAGAYWACMNADNSTVVMNAGNNSVTTAAAFVGGSTQAAILNTASTSGFEVFTALTFGTWGDLSGASWTEVNSTAGSGVVMLQAN